MERPISRARWLPETRTMRFQEAYAGWQDKRLTQEEAGQLLGVRGLYSAQYSGWNVKHFHTWYAREHQGTRSYSWVKNVLQEAKLVVRSKARGKHRKKR